MIKQKKKQCDGPCGEMKFIWKNEGGKRYCKECSYTTGVAISGKSKPKPQQPLISPRSPKLARKEVAYNTLRLVFLKDHPNCQAKLPGCILKSYEVHHKKGRGEYLLDTTTWLACCRFCHDWIEKHPEEAIQLGFSDLRLETNNE